MQKYAYHIQTHTHTHTQTENTHTSRLEIFAPGGSASSDRCSSNIFCSRSPISYTIDMHTHKTVHTQTIRYTRIRHTHKTVHTHTETTRDTHDTVHTQTQTISTSVNMGRTDTEQNGRETHTHTAHRNTQIITHTRANTHTCTVPSSSTICFCISEMRCSLSARATAYSCCSASNLCRISSQVCGERQIIACKSRQDDREEV